MSPAVVRRYELSRAFSRCAACAVGALGVSALVGWWLNRALLMSVAAGFVAMNPVTAVEFILAGVALYLLRDQDSMPSSAGAAGRMIAATVVALAVLCLSRLYTPWDLGVDRLLFRDQVAQVIGGFPNRMAPNTGLSLVLLGTALGLLDYRAPGDWRPAYGLAAVAGGLGLAAAVGYAYNSSALYGVGAFIPMALNTAVGILALAAGVFCARPRGGLPAVALGSGPGGVLARRLLPATLFVPLVLGWLYLKGHEAGIFDPAGGIALLSAATTLIVAVLIWQAAVSLNRSDLARRRAEENLQALNGDLEARVAQRTTELRQATAELQALFDASPLAICSVTLDGEVRSWNRAAERLFGWRADEVVGRPLPTIPPHLLGEHRGLRERALSGNPFTDVETKRLHRDGRLLDVSISTAALYDAAGVTHGVVAVYVDVSDRKALEAQLHQAQKMEAIARLAGGVAHDFNNVLTVIHTVSELLVADLPGDDGRRADAAEIRDAAGRGAALTRQLLAFSRRQVLRPRSVNVNRVVMNLEPMTRRLVEESVSLVTRLAPDVDRIKVDPGQLEQVLLNLVVNARDAMPLGGTLLIQTANVVLDQEYPQSHLSTRPGHYVVLTVTDTGCGMDAATQSRLFEPFFTTKPPGQGTGLGLATVYGIVKQSGGSIWVYSEVGRGTTFKIYFPQHLGPEDAPAAGTGSRPPAGNLAGRTILIVEDEAAVRSAVRRLLERSGCRVVEAASGADALAALAESPQRVDLVISDIVMPAMSGLELQQQLRQLRPSLPVLLMSGYTEEALNRLGGTGPLPFLVEKPFTVDEILAKVRDLLPAGVADA
jgi:two-component system, cell cycle sensor histidine kinase and response regulator CckA